MRVKIGLTWGHPRPGGTVPLVPYASTPLPQRSEGNDTLSPDSLIGVPKEIQYQTFWRGNLLPNTTIHTVDHAQWLKFRTQDQLQPQRSGFTFGRQLSQTTAAAVIARWHDLWTKQQ